MIFVVPSNRLVEIVRGKLHLRPARPGRIAPSVDLLLETAATAFGPGLTAVILTGSGSDGSAGAWHVKQAGGSVVIENPATAMFPSMPRSISPSLVDATADLDSIGAVLRDLLTSDGVPVRRSRRQGVLGLARTRPRAERHRLQHLPERDDHPPPPRPDGRNRPADAGRVCRPPRSRSGGIRQAHQQPVDQGDRVLPGSEGVPVPPRRGPAGADQRGTAARTRASRLVGRMLDRRGGLFAGHDARRGDGRRSETLGRAGLRHRHRQRGHRLRPPGPVSAGSAAEGAACAPEAVLHEVRWRLRGRQDVAVADDLRRARPRRQGAVSADRSRPLPQRAHLLHAADAAGRARDVRVLAPCRRTPGPGSLGDSRRATSAVHRGAGSPPGVSPCTRPGSGPALAAEVAPNPARSRPVPRHRDPVDAPRHPDGGGLDRGRRGPASHPGPGARGRRSSLLHRQDQRRGEADAGNPWHCVRPGFHSPRRIPAVHRGPGGHRCGAERQGHDRRLPGGGGRHHTGRGSPHRGRRSTERGPDGRDRGRGPRIERRHARRNAIA